MAKDKDNGLSIRPLEDRVVVEPLEAEEKPQAVSTSQKQPRKSHSVVRFWQSAQASAPILVSSFR